MLLQIVYLIYTLVVWSIDSWNGEWNNVIIISEDQNPRTKQHFDNCIISTSSSASKVYATTDNVLTRTVFQTKYWKIYLDMWNS